jgi:magnesium chelatase family protein
MLAKVHSCAVVGLDAELIDVEVDIASGLERVTLVGLPDTAVRESSERVRAAITNSGFVYPQHRLTVNLAPADLRKEGPAYDLPIAVGILAATRQITANLTDALILGELSLDGSVRHVNGVLPMASMAHERGYRRLFVPQSDAPEAALVEGLEVFPIASLAGLIYHLNGHQPLPCFENRLSFDEQAETDYPVDFADIRGQMYM